MVGRRALLGENVSLTLEHPLIQPAMGSSRVCPDPPRALDPGAAPADKKNMGTSEVKQLPNPPTAKAS
jgi:hypothetical protein